MKQMHLCQRCGGLTHLIGSEPHSVETETDLLTYYCAACDEYFVFPSDIKVCAAFGEPIIANEATRMTVIELFRATAFDPKTLSMLFEAYDQAHRSLDDSGQPDIVNEVIAQRIIALAEKGERDPDRLCAEALTALGNKAH